MPVPGVRRVYAVRESVSGGDGDLKNRSGSSKPSALRGTPFGMGAPVRLGVSSAQK
jgi:hypothetical protein